MTRRQRRIKERNATIRSEYSQLQRETHKSPKELFELLAEKNDLSPSTIESIVWRKDYCMVSEYGQR